MARFLVRIDFDSTRFQIKYSGVGGMRLRRNMDAPSGWDWDTASRNCADYPSPTRVAARIQRSIDKLHKQLKQDKMVRVGMEGDFEVWEDAPKKT